MILSTFSRLLAVGAVGAALAACSNGTSQTPNVSTQSAQKPSAFSERQHVESTVRTALGSMSNCTTIVDSYGESHTAKIVATGAKIDHATVNAAGCDFGIYIPQNVSGQTIDHTSVLDANQKGIFADRGSSNTTIDHTTVSKIGNHDDSGKFAPNGVQTGIGLYFRGASGSVDHADISQYQKNGTAFNCYFADDGTCLQRSSVSVQHSTATGLGKMNYIAQNGFQYWDSNAPVFEHNTTTNNMYLNPADQLYNQSATGFLFLCTNVTSEQQLRKQHNDASHNDINYYVTNDPAQCQ